MDPVPSFYENDSTPSGGTIINSGNQVAFGSATKGSVAAPTRSGQTPFHLWNDKNGGSAKTMKSVTLTVKDSSGGNTGQFISGTSMNSNKPFFEMRSQGSSGCPDDAQASFKPVGGTIALAIGDIPPNSRRSIYVQCNVPADATSGAGLLAGQIVVDYSFDA